MDLSAKNDEQLGRLVAGRTAGEAADSFAVLYDRYAAISERFIAGRTNPNRVADIHQETWTAAWKSATQFTGGSYKNWLLTIAARKVIDHDRKVKRRPEEALPDDPMNASTEPTVIDKFLAAEEIQRLAECMEKLTERAQQVVRERLSGKSYAVICKALDLSESAAHKLLYHAKAELKSCLDGKPK